jgi:hypothetical protein
MMRKVERLHGLSRTDERLRDHVLQFTWIEGVYSPENQTNDLTSNTLASLQRSG